MERHKRIFILIHEFHTVVKRIRRMHSTLEKLLHIEEYQFTSEEEFVRKLCLKCYFIEK